MPTILVADDEAITRHLIINALANAGHDVLGAKDGGEALSLARQHNPDLILLDYFMPHIDGATALKRIRQDPTIRDTPVIMLTTANQRNHIVRLAKHGIDGYILKSSFEVEGLISRIDSVLNKPDSEAHDRKQPTKTSTANADYVPKNVNEILAEIPPLITGKQVLAPIRQHTDLVPIGPLAAHVANVIQNKSASASELVDIIQLDPAMTVRILVESSTADKTESAKCDSLESAVVRLGMDKVKAIATDMIGDNPFNESLDFQGADFPMLWEHSIICAVTASQIVAHSGGSTTEIQAAYLAGLLHDVGRSLFAQTIPTYALVIDAAKKYRLPLQTIERHMVGIDHTAVIDENPLLKQLPESIKATIFYHHQSISKIQQAKPNHLRVITTVALADRFAHAMMLSVNGNDFVESTIEYAELLGLKPDAISKAIRSVPQHVNRLKMLLMNCDIDVKWSEYHMPWQNYLNKPLNSVYLSDEPAFDAHHLFFNSISVSDDNQPPNLAAVFIDTFSDPTELSDKLLQIESEFDIDPLPLLLMSPDGKLGLDADLVNQRPVIRVPEFMHVFDLIDCTQTLLSVSNKQHAQADRTALFHSADHEQ